MRIVDSLGGAVRGRWVALALAIAALATQAAPDAPAAASSRAALLYHNYCSVCHGDNGNGKSRASGALSTVPRDFTSEASKRELTHERIALAIAHGVPGTAMVSWKTQLSQADIATLAEHVHTRFVQGDHAAAARSASSGATQEGAAAVSGTHAHGGREADAAPDATARGFPNQLKGNLRRGSAFYMANCATCHGAGGDGAGPRAYFINPKPRNFIEAAPLVRLNRATLYNAVAQGKLGTEMPAWKQVASPQQIADVSEYVYQAFIAPHAGVGDASSVRAPR